MALGHYIKGEMLKEFEEKLNRSRSVILCRASGLKAREMVELRARMAKENVDFFLIKNSLAAKAFQNRDLNIAQFLAGDTFYVFGKDDPLAASRILMNFSRTHEALKVKGGIIDKKLVDSNEIRRYAEIPSKEILLAELVSRLKAPINNLVSVLQSPLRMLVVVLEAIRNAKDKEAKGKN